MMAQIKPLFLLDVDAGIELDGEETVSAGMDEDILYASAG
jgi:hypothetical protein